MRIRTLSRKLNFTFSLFTFKKTIAILSLLFLLLTIPLIAVISQHKQQTKEYAAGSNSLIHFTGGFSIDTVDKVSNAAGDGIQVDMKYGSPYLSSDTVGQALIANNMKETDGTLWLYLYYYECHKQNTCSLSVYPELTSESALLNDVTSHLQQEQSNSLITGYWILDDWPSNDYGSAKIILKQITTLVHQYTPGRHTICGFGGALTPLNNPYYQLYGWNDGVADNFSPQGCDMVGLYNYADSGSTGTYDWTMPLLLWAEFTSLKNRGWDINQTPLIGVAQAFGGLIGGETWPTPDATDIEAQSKSYCQKGATGIVYYAWDNSGTDSTSQFPWNNAGITQGIQNGIAECKIIWNQTTGITTNTPILTPISLPTNTPTPTKKK